MIEAIVLGRVGVDFTPASPRTSLAAATSFVRAVGGFAGNVGTGLARLGISTAVVSSVGDDGHGEHVRAFLAAEGVDVDGVITRAGTRTQVAFFEAWPPETFPVTFYRLPPAPDTQLTIADVDPVRLDAAPVVVVSAALLAGEPARSAVLAVLEARAASGCTRVASLTTLDLDWRPTLWTHPDEAPTLVDRAARLADVLIGSDGEFAAARVDPCAVIADGAALVALKHGPEGVSVLTRDGRSAVEGIPVEVVCGLGAGDAFTAAFLAGLLRGLDPMDAAERGNAAGAIVASRLMCSASMPVPSEIDDVLARHRGAKEARA